MSPFDHVGLDALRVENMILRENLKAALDLFQQNALTLTRLLEKK